MTTWISPSKSTTNWSGNNKATVEKAILTEDSFVLLTEDNFYILQEDTSLEWLSPSTNTTQGLWNALTKPWQLSNPWEQGQEISWTSPTKN